MFHEKEQKIYVLGGCCDSGPTRISDCEAFSIEKNEWKKIHSMSEPKANASACVVDNKFIFAIGGHRD